MLFGTLHAIQHIEFLLFKGPGEMLVGAGPQYRHCFRPHHQTDQTGNLSNNLHVKQLPMQVFMRMERALLVLW